MIPDNNILWTFSTLLCKTVNSLNAAWVKILKPKKYVENTQVTNYLEQKKKQNKKFYVLTGRDFDKNLLTMDVCTIKKLLSIFKNGRTSFLWIAYRVLFETGFILKTTYSWNESLQMCFCLCKFLNLVCFVNNKHFLCIYTCLKKDVAFCSAYFRLL